MVLDASQPARKNPIKNFTGNAILTLSPSMSSGTRGTAEASRAICDAARPATEKSQRPRDLQAEHRAVAPGAVRC